MKELTKLAKRIVNFRKKSPQEKFASYAYRWIRWFPGVPAPVRPPIGFWWLMDNDFIGRSLLEGGYENAECNFEKRFVKPGMTVLDIGAHRGFHTLLLSKKVGQGGRVISFEPSPRDAKRLNLHLKMNFCRNVEIKDCALGEESGSANLYVVQAETVCNSLKPPDTDLPASATSIQIRKLDDVLAQSQVKSVDFIKLDIEGGELSALKGARRLLEKVPRPVILCEVLEKRTRPWGYPARLIIEYLSQRKFLWFELGADAELLPLDCGESEFNGNFVAVPIESLSTVAKPYAPTQ
ncbi:MAG: FkbM family methyltransferase [Candidatus Acidiferrum sp.]